MTTLVLYGDSEPVTRAVAAASDATHAGMTWLARHAVLRPILLETMVFVTAINMISVCEVKLFVSTLHASPTMYGLAGATYGFGLVVASIASAKISNVDPSLIRGLFLSILVIAVAITAVGWTPSTRWALPLFLCAGMGNGVAVVCMNTLVTNRAPVELRGRIFSALNAVFTTTNIAGIALGGVMVTGVSPRSIFQIAGIVSGLSVVVFGPLAMQSALRSPARDDA